MIVGAGLPDFQFLEMVRLGQQMPPRRCRKGTLKGLTGEPLENSELSSHLVAVACRLEEGPLNRIQTGRNETRDVLVSTLQFFSQTHFGNAILSIFLHFLLALSPCTHRNPSSFTPYPLAPSYLVFRSPKLNPTRPGPGSNPSSHLADSHLHLKVPRVA